MKRSYVFSLFVVFHCTLSAPMSSSCAGCSSTPIDSFPISSVVINGNVTIQFFNKALVKLSNADKNDENEEHTSNKVTEHSLVNVTKNTLNNVTDNKLNNVTKNTLNNVTDNKLNNVTKNTLNNVTENALNKVAGNTCKKVVKNCDCKKKVIESPKIPAGYHAIPVPTKDNNRFLTTIKFHGETKTWNQARIICDQEQGFLSYPTNAKETELYHKMMRYHKASYLWTGIHNMFAKGMYTTTLGERARFAADLKWAKGQPDHWKNNENCVQLRWDGLNDVKCNSKYAFICKVKLPRCQ